jgi:hypothetical protein
MLFFGKKKKKGDEIENRRKLFRGSKEKSCRSASSLHIREKEPFSFLH